MEITLRDGIEEQIIRIIAEGVQERINERISEAVRGAIKAALEPAVKQAVDDAIAPVVQEVLAEGWQPTDRWGEPVGKATSLRARINLRVTEYLDKPSDTYHRKSPFAELVDEEIAKALREDTGKALAAAREKLNAQVDAVISAKLRESMAKALGLKAEL